MRKRIILALLLLGGAIYFIPKSLMFLSLRLGNQPTEDGTVNEKSFLFAPNFEPLPEATNSATLKVSGYAQGADQVEIFINGISKKKPRVEKDGSFSVSSLELFEGENKISAIALTDKGDKSGSSKVFSVLFSKKAPQIKLEDLDNGKSFSGERRVTLKGQVEPDSATLEINGRLVVVREGGLFSHIFSLSDGDNKITFTATDLAGNRTVLERTVRYSP